MKKIVSRREILAETLRNLRQANALVKENGMVVETEFGPFSGMVLENASNNIALAYKHLAKLMEE